MNTCHTIACVILVICLQCHLTTSQLPPRLAIPGAVLLQQSKPFRQQRILQQPDGGPPRLRRPIPNASPAPIRPVVEEVEESSTPSSSNFDDEVSKLGISSLQSAVRQAAAPEEESIRPVSFRPERPVPLLRQDIRDSPVPVQRPLPVFRQELPQRPLPRPLPKLDDIPLSRPPQQVRARQQIPQVAPQPIRQPARQPTRQYADDEEHHQGRTRKPPVQILRKYRTDNPDGSITWGYENEDGTFKEETLGIDCVTKGKYGYIDPDGVRREYNYETGNKCDEPEEEELLPQGKPIQPQPRKPLSQQQPQFRPAPAQY